jgi:hypothetical protein
MGVGEGAWRRNGGPMGEVSGGRWDGDREGEWCCHALRLPHAVSALQAALRNCIAGSAQHGSAARRVAASPSAHCEQAGAGWVATCAVPIVSRQAQGGAG